MKIKSIFSAVLTFLILTSCGTTEPLFKFENFNYEVNNKKRTLSVNYQYITIANASRNDTTVLGSTLSPTRRTVGAVISLLIRLGFSFSGRFPLCWGLFPPPFIGRGGNGFCVIAKLISCLFNLC